MGEDKKSEGKPVANAANKCVFTWKTPVYSWIRGVGLEGRWG